MIKGKTILEKMRAKKAVLFALPIFAAMLFALSCGREDAEPGCGENCNVTNKASVSNTAAKHGAALADNGRLVVGDAQKKDYAAEIRQLASTNNLTGDVRLEVDSLFREITETMSKVEAVRLFDDAMDIATRQALIEPAYRKVRLPRKVSFEANATEARYGLEPSYFYREGHVRRLWHITHAAFLHAQPMRDNSNAGWDGLFAFYRKCTGEISAVEKELLGSAPNGSASWRMRTEDYLRFVKSELKQYVHEIKYFEIERPGGLANGMTKEQKADLLRRLNEVEAFAEMTAGR